MVTCSTCDRVRGFRHTCAPKSDFKGRRRKQETARKRAKRTARRKQAAADRRAPDKVRKAVKGTRSRPPRPRAESHEPGTCGDRECPKFGCKAYWAGMADCPGPHDGG